MHLGYIESFVPYVKIKLYDPDMDFNLIKIINEYGYENKNLTNVKAEMTSYQSQERPGFDKLGALALSNLEEASLRAFNVGGITAKLIDIWGVRYTSDEFTVSHNHYPADWAFCYYLAIPDGAPGLTFVSKIDGEEKTRTTIPIEGNCIYYWPGHLDHLVEPGKFEGYRYCCAGNIKLTVY